jgi:hypothetical protein
LIRFSGILLPLLFWVGLQVSGYQNPNIAWALWTIAAVWAVFLYVYVPLRKRVHVARLPTGGLAIGWGLNWKVPVPGFTSHGVGTVTNPAEGWERLAVVLKRQRQLVRDHYAELEQIIGPAPGPKAVPTPPPDTKGEPERRRIEPLSLRVKLARFADEIEEAVEEWQGFPVSLQDRVEDTTFRRFLPRLREFRRQLMEEKVLVPEPLASVDGMARLSEKDALDMVAALRALDWTSQMKPPPTMRRIVYLGPGDMVELDGLKVRKGEPIDLTPAQVARVQASDPEARVAKVLYRFIAPGQYYVGIPARDLTEEDYAALAPEQQALVAAEKLYTRLKQG